jgi:hypothetical protein
VDVIELIVGHETPATLRLLVALRGLGNVNQSPSSPSGPVRLNIPMASCGSRAMAEPVAKHPKATVV